MPDTLPNIALPANTWVNLYAESLISTGTKIVATSLTPSTFVRLVAKGTIPTNNDGYAPIRYGEPWMNDAGDSGAWAYSPNVDGIINVGVA